MATLILFFISSCCKEEPDLAGKNTSTDSTSVVKPSVYYFTYRSEGRMDTIACDTLIYDTRSNMVFSPTSASGKEIFYLYLPRDSSSLVQAENIARYAIAFNGRFSVNISLPYSKDSTIRMIGFEQSVDSGYHDIKEIAYNYSDGVAAYFSIKSNYGMYLRPFNSKQTDTLEYVSGSYSFLVKCFNR